MRTVMLLCLGLWACGGGDPPPPANSMDPPMLPVDPNGPRCTGKAAAKPGTAERMITAGGLLRSYLLHVPKNYNPERPTAVVLAFHGYLRDPDSFFYKTVPDMEAELEQRGIIGIIPQGYGPAPGWNAGSCCGTAVEQMVDDVAFVRELLAAAKDELCVAEDQVYAMGFSNGAMFTYRLGCELADQIAAVGPVAGVLLTETCEPTRSVPLKAFHGDADHTVAYAGSKILGFPPVQENWRQWAARANCQNPPMGDDARGDTTCESYRECGAGAPEVTLCTVKGWGHDWPTQAQGMGATATLMDFFQSVRRP